MFVYHWLCALWPTPSILLNWQFGDNVYVGDEAFDFGAMGRIFCGLCQVVR